jgi:hypothetical protein
MLFGCILLQCHQEKSILPEIISSSVIIILFICERFINHFLRKKDKNKEWYLDVLIKPNIIYLNQFFDKISLQLTLSKEKLCSNTTLQHAAYTQLVSTEILILQNLKREFEFAFIYLISSYNPEIANDLTDIVRDIEDIFTNALSKNEINDLDLDDVQTNIYLKKSIFLKKLYSILDK